MQASLWERFKYWLCDTFGHRKAAFSHAFNGKNHYNCKFCGRMESKPIKKR